MIGETVEFSFKSKTGLGLIGTGKVLDKIRETHGRVARGWAMSAGSNNVAVHETNTYYMVSISNGDIFRVPPSNIIKIVQK